LATLLFVAGAARAQERDPAAAQALFDQARDLMRQGKFAEACPKLQESNRLDPGIGTQFNLADCYEQSGRVASAWAAFLEVASQARATNQPERERAASKRAERLEPRLPRLVVNVPEASKTAGLEVRRNGMLVGAAQWGTPVAVDPGEIELTASAPGKQALRQTLRVEEGKTASYNLPVLTQGDGAGVAPPVTTPVATAPQPATLPAPAAPAAPPVPPPSQGATTKAGNGPWIITLAGVGVVGLGLGTAYALMAKSKYDESKSDCDLDDVNTCGNTGIDLRNNARTKGDIATVSFIVGGAALAGAGIVWLASGSSDSKHAASVNHLRAAPAVGPNLAALFVQGRF
jgi:serine/threonine-protein kinase